MVGDVRLGFTGDVMLGRLVNDVQRRRAVTAVWDGLLDQLRALDGLFVNLECCLSTRGDPWTATYRPFHFRADPDWAIPALREVGVDWASLANNHVLDFEEVALLDTLDALDGADVAHCGAGRTVDAAREPAAVSVDEVDVGLFAVTDNTPEYAADEDSPGTAHVDVDVDDAETRAVVTDALSTLRATDPDLVVASLHWGPNMVERPPERFQRFAHWLAERGVDLVHGHSAHVFQGVEVHDGTVILYDTGDFVDDYAVDPDLRNDRSFLFEVTVAADATPPIREVRLVPTEIYDFAVHHADPVTAEWSRDRMRRLSDPFGTDFRRDGRDLVLTPE